MSNLKKLKKQLDDVVKKKKALTDEEEIIKLKIESSTVADLLTILPGTSWRINRDGDCLEYESASGLGAKSDTMEKRIYDEYGLYPHGSKHLTENIVVGCSDHTIYIRTELCGKSFGAIRHQDGFDRVCAQVLIDFANVNKMKINCRQGERMLQDAKDNVAFLEKQLAMINELIGSKK
jgi:hypothetical protein